VSARPLGQDVGEKTVVAQGVHGTDHLHARGTLGGKAMNDPLVEEIRKVRFAHAARFDYNLDAIFRDIKDQEKKSGRQFVSFVPRKAEPNRAQQGAEAAMPVSLRAEPARPAP
jgi:hypothetical protein